jgi:hypothetical protein
MRLTQLWTARPTGQLVLGNLSDQEEETMPCSMKTGQGHQSSVDYPCLSLALREPFQIKDLICVINYCPLNKLSK